MEHIAVADLYFSKPDGLVRIRFHADWIRFKGESFIPSSNDPGFRASFV